MTDKSESRRPSQVTLAGWVALVGSLLMVLSLFEAVAALQTVDFRDAVAEFLATPPGNGLGVDTPEYVEFLRQLVLFSGAAGAAVAVFAVFVLQRHKGARVGLTIAAGLTMLATAPFSGAPMAELRPLTTSAVVVPLAFASILLWTRPARDWFAGRPVAQPRAGAPSPSADPFAVHRPPRRIQGRALASESRPPQDDPGEDTAPWPKMPEDPSGRPVPPPTHGFGTPPGQTPQSPGAGGYPGAPGGQPPQQGSGQSPQQGQPQAGSPYPPPSPGGQQPYGQSPYGEQPYGQQAPYGGYPSQYGQAPYGEPTQAQPPYGQPYYGAGPSAASQRPTTVTAAAFITWIFSALALVGMVITAVRIPTARDEIIRQLQNTPEFQQSGLTVDDVVAVLWVMIAISFFWAVAAILLAWFAYRRANWARITLVVSAGMTALFSLIGIVGNPILLLGVIAAGSVVALLFSGGANQWYARRPAFQGYPGAFQPYGAPQRYTGQPQPYGAQPGQSQPYGGQPGQPQPYVAQPGEPQPYGGQPGQPDQQGQGQPPQYGSSYPGQQGPDQQGPGQQGRPEAPRKRGKDEPPPNVW